MFSQTPVAISSVLSVVSCLTSSLLVSTLTAAIRAGGLDLPDVVPTISWVRLAQRVPVRIHIDRLPEGDELVARLSASVAVGQ